MKLATLAALQVSIHRYGFFGIEGFFGIIVGIICLIIIVGICWRILAVILPKLVPDAGWQEVIRWLFILLIFIAFLHFFGIY